MVRCHLQRLMQQRKLRISDVARGSGLNRSTIAALCRDRATRVELPAVDRLCLMFDCSVGELFEYVPDARGARA